ncbi:MAG TPA: DUF6188 family protein [Gemmatimonadaceae bacterium]
MQASLIESSDEHHWVLLDHRITQLMVGTAAVRLQSWSLDGSLEIRLGAPFTLRMGKGSARTLDPADAPALAPMLSLLGRPLRSVTISRRGDLTLDMGSGTSIVASPHRRLDAWEVQGAGSLEGLAYACGIGGAGLAALPRAREE